MRARAHVATELEVRPDGRARTRIASLRSEAPLCLRPAIRTGRDPWTDRDDGAARVSIAAGAGGPVGGDRLTLRVDVGAASTLVLRDVSATLLLPGPRDEQSRIRVDAHVGDGATFVWLPEPLIAARGCRHAGDVRITLDAGARLLLRAELVRGRHGERGGNIRQHIRVRLDGRPLLDQQLALGPDIPGFDGPAVTGGHRAIGSVLVVDPSWSDGAPPATPLDGDAAVMPLGGPAVLVSALCADGLALRRSLDRGLALLEHAPAATGPDRGALTVRSPAGSA
jgi:urease accessory protein